MRSRPIIAFYFAIGILVVLSIAVAYKLVFQPLCTPTKDIPCPVTDAGSIAGIAGTVMGVAATVLALLGAFAVAAWWSQLDDRVNDRVNNLLQDQSVKFNEQMKELQHTLTEADNNLNNNLQNFSRVQDATIKNINDVGEALLYLSVGTRLWEQKKIKSAIVEFRKAKQLQPGDAQVNYILGEIYRKIGLYDEAIVCLETAIAAEKEFALAHFELGMAYRSQADKLYGDQLLKQQHGMIKNMIRQ
jgi:tetratricopeptide (TPR) repeat protein